MIRLFRLALMIVLIALVSTGVAFFVTPAEDRHELVVWFKYRVLGELEGRAAQVATEIHQLVPAKFLEQFQEVEGFQEIARCGKTQTTALEKSTVSDIYRWVDENGNVHFSDSKPGETRNTQVMSVSYPDRKAYFKLQVIEDTETLPVFIRDKITAEVRQVYRILSRNLELAHLRKVFLNVRIIGTQTDFQNYRQQRAPQLRTNSGFYTSDNNEAVVFQNDDPEVMRAVIRHEATHVIMAGLYGATPSWFNEGMAEYFEQLKVSGQARQIGPVSDHWIHLQHRLEAEQLPALRDYLNLAPQPWYAGDLRDHYGMAWSLIFYLMSDAAGKGFLKAMMNEMAENYCRAAPGSTYFDNHYPGGFEALESGWKNWLATAEPTPHRY